MNCHANNVEMTFKHRQYDLKINNWIMSSLLSSTTYVFSHAFLMMVTVGAGGLVEELPENLQLHFDFFEYFNRKWCKNTVILLNSS